MSVEVSFPLFTRPAQELPPGCDERITQAQLHELADRLDRRILKAATIVGALSAAGWHTFLCGQEVCCLSAVATPAQARSRIEQLGIDPAEANIRELDDNGEYVGGTEPEDAIHALATGRQE
jgi:hypothetical protein